MRAAVTVMMELQGALHDVGLNFTVIPDGRPCDTARTTGFAVEPGMLIDVLTLPPCATTPEAGVNESSIISHPFSMYRIRKILFHTLLLYAHMRMI